MLTFHCLFLYVKKKVIFVHESIPVLYLFIYLIYVGVRCFGMGPPRST